MGKLTPFGTLLVIAFILVVVLGGLAVTNNLRWPPFTINLGVPTPAGTATQPPQALSATQTPVADPAVPATAAAPPPAASVAVPSATAAPPTRTPSPPPDTATPTPTSTSTATPTPTPAGVVYVGALDVSGLTGGAAPPQPLATDPAAARLYVAGSDAQGPVLAVYDENSLQRQATVRLDLGSGAKALPVQILVHAPTHRVYVVASNGRVAAVDSTALGAASLPFNLGQPVDRAFLSQDGTKIYGLLADQPGSGGPLLRLLDLHAIVTRGIKVPSRWSGDSGFVDGNTLYITGRDGLLGLDMTTSQFGSPVVLGFQPLFPIFDPAARRLYAWRQPQSVPLVPELVALSAGAWQVTAHLTHAGCPCALAFGPGRQRLYLAIPTAPGQVLAFSPPDTLAASDGRALPDGPALSLLASARSNRIYVQSSGAHPIQVLQDNGPVP